MSWDSGSPRARTVLVAEADRQILLAARTALDATGLRVLTATSGVDALHRLHSAPDPVDLMVMDLSLEGAEGSRLADLVKRQHPSLMLVLLSDQREEGVWLGDLEGEPVLVVHKPFRPEALLIAIHASLVVEELPR